MVIHFFQFIFKKIARTLNLEENGGCRKGFTMIELLVVVTIFVVVVGISADIFTSSFAAQRQARKLQDILDNARYGLERIAKTARVACVLNSDSVTSTSSLKLYHFRRDRRLTYEEKNGDLIEREEGGGVEASLIGSENVDIENLNFELQGVGSGDGQQPRITVLLGLKPKLPEYKDQVINIQTTVSTRFLEKYYASSSVCVSN